MTNETTNEQEVLLLRRKLDLLLRTGKMLMESAADTNRIERNMKRVAAYLGIPEEKLHIDIRWTMLMVNVSDEKHSFSSYYKYDLLVFQKKHLSLNQLNYSDFQLL